MSIEVTFFSFEPVPPYSKRPPPAVRQISFATETGEPVDPRNLFRALVITSNKAGISGVGLHTLRHSAATTMLEAGVPIHVVSRVLGHSGINITVDIYGHVSNEASRLAMEALGKKISGL